MLNRLNDEVLALGAQACLPTRLPEEWLVALSDSADALLGNSTTNDSSTGAACLAVLICILQAKREGTADQLEIPMELMREYVLRYRMELALEEIRRKADIKYEPATLSSILTEREVKALSGGDGPKL